MSKRLLPVLAIAAVIAGGTVGAAGIPNDTAAIEHALNRLAYGPRAGDVERVQAMGLSKWIDQQLHPDAIDDSALKERLPEQPAKPERFADQMEARRWGRESVQTLGSEKLIRAVYSERQLEEVLVDFWFNHFNVFAGKGRTSEWIADYEKHAIRPHVLGRFRDLLEATAKSPAMLFYLDNWLSADPAAAERQQELQRQRAARLGGSGNQQQQQQGRRRGLNENYGRELLELHTLGVDGGYTQKDIIEVARAFTGWTIVPPNLNQAANRPGLLRRGGGAGQLPRGAIQQGEFRFTPMLHDTGEKVVLGTKIKAGGGLEDGEQVLDIVSRHPATAHHIAYELVQRFVSDEPPKALVDRAAKKFRDTNGDLREVVRTIITSDEFFAARNAKVKTPLEFLASALRATGRDIPGDGRPMLQALMQMGMPLYMCQPPTGYDDTADTWVSAGALVARMNIAQRIAGPQKAADIGGPDFQRR